MRFTVIITAFVGTASDRAVKEARGNGSTPLLFDDMKVAGAFYDQAFRTPEEKPLICVIGEFAAVVEEEVARQET